MSKIIKKVSKIAIKAVTLAGLSKLGLMLVKKFNKDGTFEEKSYNAIDVQGEKVKNLAKAGVSKTISATEKIEEKAEELESEKESD